MAEARRQKQMGEIVKIMELIGTALIESLDKNGELPLMIMGIILMYAIEVYMKIIEDDGFAPNPKPQERRK